MGLPEAINASFDDLLRQGRPSRAWLRATAATFAFHTRPTDIVAGRIGPSVSAPSRPLSADGGACGGTYANGYVGTATVVEGERLVLALDPQGRTRLALRPRDGDGWASTAGDAEGFLAAVRFSGNEGGQSTELSLEMIHEPQGTLLRQGP